MTTSNMTPYVEFGGKRITAQTCNDQSVYGILASRGLKISWVTGQGKGCRIVENKVYYDDKIWTKND